MGSVSRGAWIRLGLFFIMGLAGLFAMTFMESDRGVMICGGVVISGMGLIVINWIVAVVCRPS